MVASAPLYSGSDIGVLQTAQSALLESMSLVYIRRFAATRKGYERSQPLAVVVLVIVISPSADMAITVSAHATSVAPFLISSRPTSVTPSKSSFATVQYIGDGGSWFVKKA